MYKLSFTGLAVAAVAAGGFLTPSLAAHAAEGATVNGGVFHDANHNGVKDANESTASGHHFSLLNEDGEVLDYYKDSADSKTFEFSGLADGKYRVEANPFELNDNVEHTYTPIADGRLPQTGIWVSDVITVKNGKVKGADNLWWGVSYNDHVSIWSDLNGARENAVVPAGNDVKVTATIISDTMEDSVLDVSGYKAVYRTLDASGNVVKEGSVDLTPDRVGVAGNQTEYFGENHERTNVVGVIPASALEGGVTLEVLPEAMVKSDFDSPRVGRGFISAKIAGADSKAAIASMDVKRTFNGVESNEIEGAPGELVKVEYTIKNNGNQDLSIVQVFDSAVAGKMTCIVDGKENKAENPQRFELAVGKTAVCSAEVSIEELSEMTNKGMSRVVGYTGDYTKEVVYDFRTNATIKEGVPTAKAAPVAKSAADADPAIAEVAESSAKALA